MRAYFEPISPAVFRATEHVAGAWRADEQHIAPALGLIAHAIEQDRDIRRDDHPAISRVSYDILGTMPIDAVTIDVRMLRPGRTIELVEAVLSHDGRPAVIARAWLQLQRDTSEVAGTALTPISGPDDMTPFSPADLWPGGFVGSIDLRRDQTAPGDARFWVRPRVDLVEGEGVSPTARALGLLDLANGMSPRASPQDVHFPNIDLTVHLFAEPRGEWLGFDTRVSFGTAGLGLTHSVLHDESGPIGAVSQTLTVRPR